MAIQAQKIAFLLEESGFEVVSVKTNADVPDNVRFLLKIKVLRTFLRNFFFLYNLHKELPQVEVVYFLTGFFNFFFWVTYPALILIKIHRKRVILSARGGEAERFFQRYGILLKPIIKKVDTISVPSGFLREVFKKAFDIDAVIVPNIVDLHQFKFRERNPVRPRLLTTRNLEKIYNVACVIRAFYKVHNRFPESTLGIVGEGSERRELEQLVAELGLNNSIKFYGRVEHAKIQTLYDQYDIYVNASNVDNFPGTILEAFASGLPVVSTNAGGIPYIVQNWKTGLLVDMNDCDALADNIIQLLHDPELALTITKNAREECKKFSWEYIKTILIPLLKNS